MQRDMLRVLILCSIIIFHGSTEAYSFVSPIRSLWRVSYVDKTSQTYHSRLSRLEMKIGKSRSKDGKGSTLQEMNNLRKRYAGKPGSKNFLDPNKVFIGNLPFDATENHVSEFLTLHLGHLKNIDSFKIIRDWKTDKSKGFGFIQFKEPIYATAALEMIKNKMLLGRVINLRQGMKKDDDETIRKRQLYVKVRSRGKYRLDEEGSIIEAALDEAEDIDTTDTDTDDMEMDTSAMAEDDDDAQKEDVFKLEDFDDVDDSILLNSDVNYDDGIDDEMEVTDDENGPEYDGDFEEIYGSSKLEELPTNGIQVMNRQQRREAAKKRPKRKLPHTGFG
jgi:hypothetical protein